MRRFLSSTFGNAQQCVARRVHANFERAIARSSIFLQSTTPSSDPRVGSFPAGATANSQAPRVCSFRPDARLSTTAALLQCLYYAWHDLFLTTEVLRVYPCGASYEAALRSVLTPDSPELEAGAKPLHALTFSIHPALFVHSPAYAVSRARTVHQFNNGPRRPVQWGGAGAPKLL